MNTADAKQLITDAIAAGLIKLAPPARQTTAQDRKLSRIYSARYQAKGGEPLRRKRTEWMRQWRAKNRERYNAYMTEYKRKRRAKRAKHREYMRQWRKINGNVKVNLDTAGKNKESLT